MGPFIRIALRYGAGYLVARGLLGQADGDTIANDPDVYAAVELFAGFTIGALTEGYYMLARRFGWSK